MQLVKVGKWIINMDAVRMISPGVGDYTNGCEGLTGVHVDFVTEQIVDGFSSAQVFVADPDGAALLSWCESRAANVAFDDLNQ